MLLAAIILLSANLVLLVWLAIRGRRTAQVLSRLRQDAEALKPLHADLNPELRQQLGEARSRVIGIEILNPIEVAAKESWIASGFPAPARISPFATWRRPSVW